MKAESEETLVRVRFNALVRRGLEAGYRLPKYDQCMRYKSFIARAIHKRLSHLFFTAASRWL